MAHQAFTTGFAQIAQLVEQETENLRVLGSIPSLGTIRTLEILRFQEFFHAHIMLIMFDAGSV